MRVATIPVGYGDGYARGLSNKGWVLVHGKRAPVIGRVCMDQFMIDVTKIPEAAQGDKVTLIGRDGEEMITMEELGNFQADLIMNLPAALVNGCPEYIQKAGRFCGRKTKLQIFDRT